MKTPIQKSVIALASLLTISAVTGCGNSGGSGGAPAKQVFRVGDKPSHDVSLKKISLSAELQIDDTIPHGQVKCTAMLLSEGGMESLTLLLSGGDQVLCNGIPMGDNVVDETPTAQIVNGLAAQVPASSDGRYTITFVRDGLPYTGIVQMATSTISDARVSPVAPGPKNDIGVEWDPKLNEFDKGAGISPRILVLTQRQTERGLEPEFVSSYSRSRDAVQFYRAEDTSAKAWSDTVTIVLALESYGSINGLSHGLLKATKKHSIAVQTAH